MQILQTPRRSSTTSGNPDRVKKDSALSHRVPFFLCPFSLGQERCELMVTGRTLLIFLERKAQVGHGELLCHKGISKQRMKSCQWNRAMSVLQHWLTKNTAQPPALYFSLDGMEWNFLWEEMSAQNAPFLAEFPVWYHCSLSHRYQVASTLLKAARAIRTTQLDHARFLLSSNNTICAFPEAIMHSELL